MWKKEGDVELTMVIKLVDEIPNRVKDSMSLPILESPLNDGFSINRIRENGDEQSLSDLITRVQKFSVVSATRARNKMFVHSASLFASTSMTLDERCGEERETYGEEQEG